MDNQYARISTNGSMRLEYKIGKNGMPTSIYVTDEWLDLLEQAILDHKRKQDNG